MQALLGAELACVLGLLHGVCAVPDAEKMSLKMNNALFGCEEVFHFILKDVSKVLGRKVTHNSAVMRSFILRYFVFVCFFGRGGCETMHVHHFSCCKHNLSITYEPNVFFRTHEIIRSNSLLLLGLAV